MYVSSRQGYKPPVKSTGRGKKYSHFASLKYCNGAETFYTYDPQRGKAGGQMAHTNTYGTDTGKKFQLANVKDVMGTNSKVSNKNATKIQVGQKKVAKAIKNSPQTFGEISTSSIIEYYKNNNSRNEQKKK